jgi:hypothetical protein
MESLISPEQERLAPAELTRYCRRCHRKLKVERWMKAGYGPVCINKIRQEVA